MSPAHSRPGRAQQALVPVLLSLGMLVAIISSLGAPLIPTIAAVDHVSAGTAQWSLTVTMLVGAIATPAMGRLGDGPYRRTVILCGLGTVLVGSLLAALPLGFGWLVAGRAGQGVGIGLTPLAMATIRDALPAERARHAVATLSLTSAAGVGLGYPLTGLLARFLGMHSAFWFAAMAAAATLVATSLVLPASSHRSARPLDLLSLVLLGLGLAGLLLTVTEGGSWGWAAPGLVVLGVLSLALLAWWAAHELRAEHPLVNLHLVRSRPVLAADLTAVLSGIALYLMLSMVTRFVQTPESSGYGFGASVVVAGLVLVPFSAASMVSGRLVRIASRSVPLARMLPLGCVVSLLGTGLFVLARGSLWEVFVAMGLLGLGVGVTISVMPALIVSTVPAHETGSALSFNQVVKYIGYSMGSALSAAVLDAQVAPGRPLPGDHDYTAAGLLGCAMWVLTAILAQWLVHARRGSTGTGADGTVVTGGVPRKGAESPTAPVGSS